MTDREEKLYEILDRDFGISWTKHSALKCLALGLPDLYAMKFRMPSRWDKNDQMGLEFKLP